jgi:ribosomal protein L44E
LNLKAELFFHDAGKRRYDRKQAGFGGQTKPVFHKKVSSVFFKSTSVWQLWMYSSCVHVAIMHSHQE